MNENQSLTGDDDVEAHRHSQYSGADAETPEGDDVEGHKWRPGGADAETPEGDDTEGHIYIQTPDGPKA